MTANAQRNGVSRIVRVRLLGFLGAVLVMVLLGCGSAFAADSWRIDAVSNTTVAPGGQLDYQLQVTNVGAQASGVGEVSVTLSPGMTVASGGFDTLVGNPLNHLLACSPGQPPTGENAFTCLIFPVGPHQSMKTQFSVVVDPGSSGVLTSTFTVTSLGGSESASTVAATRVSPQPPGFGVAAFDSLVASDAAGDPFTQAGGHPYSTSTSIDFNTETNPNPMIGDLWPVEATKDVVADLPAGLTGYPSAAAKCTATELVGSIPGTAPHPDCPPSSQVGTTLVRLNGLGTEDVVGPIPVYNMAAPSNVPAQFGFNVDGSVVTLTARVRADDNYSLGIDALDIPEALPVASTTVTFWGVPADPSHDGERACAGAGPPFAAGTGGPSCTSGARQTAFLRTPTSCTPPGEGLVFTAHMDSWVHPGGFDSNGEPLEEPAWQSASVATHELPGYPAPAGEWGAPVGTTGCERVPFTPGASLTPTSSTPDSPSGLDTVFTLPQEASPDPSSVAQADIRRIVLRFPEGMSVNPAVANGLDACTPGEIGLGTNNPVGCPDASKIASVQVKTPALEEPLEGSLYVASQGDNPFGSLLAVYVAAEGGGVLVKFAGKLEADPVTGRLTAIFDDLPQQPVSSIRVHIDGGSRGPLTTPSTCGTTSIVAELLGWNGKSATLESPYTVDCTPGLGGFSLSFTAGTTDPQAGGFSPFTVSLSRNDGEQALGGLIVRTPPGLLGILKSVTRCPEPQASQGTCDQGSLIGHVTASAGAGPDPVGVTGQVFLTGPYKGSPFGLSVTIPAKAGPFDLGTVVVRSRIDVDPHTSQVTITSDPFPTILQGIPLQVRDVNVTVDRPGFLFNPTNCEALAVTGTITGTQGTQAQVSSHFQAANCATLGFHPVFSISTQARTSKAAGASLDVKTTFPSGAQANIHSVLVTLPKQLPARLTTIQQACPEATFAQNPASCPAASAIGIGTASTPVLASPLVGPAYLVSHGGAAFPDVVIVFQSEGVTFDLVGGVNIRHGITTSSFASVPDAPISVFELKLPEGPHSGLAAVVPAKAKGNMCGQSLSMPIVLTAQNGATLKENPKIKVTGCPRARKAKKHARGAHGKANKPGRKGGKK